MIRGKTRIRDCVVKVAVDAVIAAGALPSMAADVPKPSVDAAQVMAKAISMLPGPLVGAAF